MQNTYEIADAWRKAKKVVVFTGAGMSTESGLPDFRSAQGLWKQRPEALATLEALYSQPGEFYFFYQWRIAKLWEVAPNNGHTALAALQQEGYVHKLITQNVDGLHQRAGSVDAIELHGTLRTVSCIECSYTADSRTLLPDYTGWEAAYRKGTYNYGMECHCPECNSSMRPDVVLFGEALPQKAWQKAQNACSEADFFVVIGSSLAVSPANYCPQMALSNGANLLIINNEPTPFDNYAKWVIREKAGEVLDRVKDNILNL
ncbi:NAD-dependent deacylase [Dendrosporobacter sp. 1207_IL3150]|uniref:NAD-dependent deacylase n=1 Tax=Dendrosporobacter sp. 1207_IL3150 TaxID=3084054 RepID=UPI002FDA5655